MDGTAKTEMEADLLHFMSANGLRTGGRDGAGVASEGLDLSAFDYLVFDLDHTLFDFRAGAMERLIFDGAAADYAERHGQELSGSWEDFKVSSDF